MKVIIANVGGLLEFVSGGAKDTMVGSRGGKT